MPIAWLNKPKSEPNHNRNHVHGVDPWQQCVANSIRDQIRNDVFYGVGVDHR